jgi:CHAT domain-containing protein/Tfp pilus assembly protein PilF
LASSPQSSARGVDHQSSDRSTHIRAGQSVEAHLSPDTVHAYDISVSAGQFVHVTVNQSFVDLAVTVLRPDGTEVRQFDATAYGAEPVFVIAEVSGTYRLRIHSVAKLTLDERYSVRLEAVREPVEGDRKRIDAATRTAEAKRLAGQRTAASLRAALAKYEEALPIWRGLEDRPQEANALNAIGFLLNALGENRKALEHYQSALAISHAANDVIGEAEVVANIGAVYSILGEKREALAYHQRALDFRRRLGDRRGEGGVLLNIGATYGELGELDRAAEFLSAAVPLLEATGERVAVAAALQNIGVLYGWMGELQKATDHYERSLAIARELGERRWEARAIYNLGSVHRALGEQREALRRYEEAVRLASDAGDRRSAATALTTMGAAYKTLGDHEQARRYYERALETWQAIGDRRGEGLARVEMGELHQERHETRIALEQSQRALALLRAVGDRRGEALALRVVAMAHLSAGESMLAEEHFLQALAFARLVKDRLNEPPILLQLARLYMNAGQFLDARAQLEAALPILESVRAGLLGHEMRAAYLASKRQVFSAYIELLMTLHRVNPADGFAAAALEASERVRARTLLDILGEAAAGIREGADPGLLARERQLQRLLQAKTEREMTLLSSHQTEAQAAVLANEVEQLVQDYRELQARIRGSSPRYAALTYPDPLEAAGIQRMLDDETVVLEYWLGDEGSYAWAVSRASIASFVLPPRAEIEAAARHLHALLSTRTAGASSGVALDAATRALGRMILDPLVDALVARRLVVVPDGALHYIPFAALSAQRSGDAAEPPEPLATGHEIVSLPSASTLAVLRGELASRPAAPRALAVLADPVFDAQDSRVKIRSTRRTGAARRSDAPPSRAANAALRSAADVGLARSGEGFPRLAFARSEAEAILRLVPSGEKLKAVDFAASRATATGGALRDYRIVHIATHGVLNPVHPELSGIVLSLVDERGDPQDGFLQLHDIYNLRLTAELVVLSACQTGLGTEIWGEGLVGLTRAVMYAGAPRVVVSLWRVDDEATADLMKHFYEGMLGPKRLRPAAALSEAQAALRRQNRWRSPYYWAGFVLQGDWK